MAIPDIGPVFGARQSGRASPPLRENSEATARSSIGASAPIAGSAPDPNFHNTTVTADIAGRQPSSPRPNRTWLTAPPPVALNNRRYRAQLSGAVPKNPGLVFADGQAPPGRGVPVFHDIFAVRITTRLPRRLQRASR